MFREELEKAALLYGMPLDADQIDKFSIYYDLLMEWNRKMNINVIWIR